jgi:CheY-like chemotaxis protein
MPNRQKILVVDDEEFNLDILNEYLTDAGFNTILAKNGLEALAGLENNMPIAAIVLDRMMPVMDGMEFLKKVKANDKYKNIPVIMQTAASSTTQVMEGIAAGVFYYLTKPYEKVTMLTIVSSALEQNIVQQKNTEDLKLYKTTAKLIEKATYNFKTLEEAKDVAQTVAAMLPDPERALFGLNELTVNAVEHGNLGITFEEKKNLIINNAWLAEIKRRLEMPEYSRKHAILHFEMKPKFYEVTIKDMGTGFDFSKFLVFDATRLTDPNGRGVAMSKMYSFDELEYKGCGNEVICRIKRT